MESFRAIEDNAIDFSFPETLHYVFARKQSYILPYRITDTGGLVEKTKVIGRRRFKELGTKARRNLWEMPCLLLI